MPKWKSTSHMPCALPNPCRSPWPGTAIDRLGEHYTAKPAWSSDVRTKKSCSPEGRAANHQSLLVTGIRSRGESNRHQYLFVGREIEAYAWRLQCVDRSEPAVTGCCTS